MYSYCRNFARNPRRYIHNFITRKQPLTVLVCLVFHSVLSKDSYAHGHEVFWGGGVYSCIFLYHYNSCLSGPRALYFQATLRV